MTLGQRIRKLRGEKGLSQRQLCGEKITRNMLSQIENGSAQPSMDTLVYLAGQLQLPVSYLLEEEGRVSVNQGLMDRARQAFAREEWEQLRELLQAFQEPDEIFAWEKALLQIKGDLALARQAIGEGKMPYAQGLLQEAGEISCPYFTRELQQERSLLLAMTGEGELTLPGLGEWLREKARLALEKDELTAAQAYLEALQAEGEEDCWLLGQVLLARQQFAPAAECFHKVEEEKGKAAFEKLEACYRGMEDYKMAYTYACKQK